MAPILPIPDLPDAIKAAVNNGKLALFVGAGVSRVMGCQGWADLARDLVSACFDQGYINFDEKERLSQGQDHRKTITICDHLMSNVHSNAGLFYDLLRSALQPNPTLEARYPIYTELSRFRGVSVTTNADELFDRLFDTTAIVYRPRDFPDAPDGSTRLYHLHGSIIDENSLVFRLKDYIDLYNENSNIQRFLKSLFVNYTVLFVGYGLDELELLEYVISSNNQNRYIQHYRLLPMFEGDDHILEFERSYYNQLGIEVIPYDIKTVGYSQIYHVLQSWQQQIDRVTKSLVNAYEIIEQTIEAFDESEAETVFQLIRNDTSLRDHFF